MFTRPMRAVAVESLRKWESNGLFGSLKGKGHQIGKVGEIDQLPKVRKLTKHKAPPRKKKKTSTGLGLHETKN